MKLLVKVVLAALLLSLFAVAADTPNAELSTDQKREAVSLMRTINTAEAQLRAKSGHFATADELTKSGAVKATNAETPLPDFKLRIVVPADGSKYQVSLIHGPSHWAVFSDEQGMIYTGQALR